MHLGKKIKLARVSKSLTQQELADLIHKTRPLISHIEQTGKVNPYTLHEICKVLDLDIANLNFDFGLVNESGETNYRTELESLRTENRLLLQEINTLRDLVASQKHLIELLQQKSA